MPKLFRYRLKPTKSQVAILNSQLDLCRWTYNETLALRKNAWEWSPGHNRLYDRGKLSDIRRC
ncbi:MAG: helix-turn-helix domain-containing protein [Methanothrix sp.]|nr:helix-turn-helix domain-containing protein [Methanothrix sp.]